MPVTRRELESGDGAGTVAKWKDVMGAVSKRWAELPEAEKTQYNEEAKKASFYSYVVIWMADNPRTLVLLNHYAFHFF